MCYHIFWYLGVARKFANGSNSGTVSRQFLLLSIDIEYAVILFDTKFVLFLAGGFV